MEWRGKNEDIKSKSKKYDRHRLVSCSYSDYLQACREELPERLVNSYNRFA